MENDGFWLYLIAQMLASGPLSDALGLTGLKRLAMWAGLFLSVVAAFFTLLLHGGGITNETARGLFRWMILLPTAGSIIATSAAMVMPRTLSKKS